MLIAEVDLAVDPLVVQAAVLVIGALQGPVVRPPRVAVPPFPVETCSLATS